MTRMRRLQPAEQVCRSTGPSWRKQPTRVPAHAVDGSDRCRSTEGNDETEAIPMSLAEGLTWAAVGCPHRRLPV
jgi:hypothetical protein